MDDAQCGQAARLLGACLDEGRRIDALPPGLHPRSRAEGYAIQAHWMHRSSAPLFGWKIAATSAAGQRHINVDAPLAGRLLAERLVPAGASVPLATNLMRVAEFELAFRLGAGLPPRERPYDIDEVVAAVATMHPAIEIPDSRYEDFCAVGAPQLIADNACANLFMLGPPATADWRRLDLAAHAVAADVEGRGRREGRGANVLGDPRIALAWLVNELSGLGIAVEAGQVVTTGTCVAPVDVVPGDVVHGEFGVLGRLTVRFA